MPRAPEPAPDVHPPAPDIQVTIATAVDDELVAAFARPIPQLSRSAALPSTGARTIELTSRPSREAANRLYQRLGFTLRESNVYRFTPGETA